MKHKYFGNKIEQDDFLQDGTLNKEKLVGNDIEFYSPVDKFSARNLNRPLLQNYEDIESVYEVLQNICKTLYGQKENGILPDIFEEMNKDSLEIGTFLSKSETYIKIPTGAFFAKLNDKQAKYYKYTKKEDNQYSRDFFIDNDRNSIIIFNKPNVDLFERQLAEHFNFNLNDQDNDIRLYYTFQNEGNITEIPKENPVEQDYINNNKSKYNLKNRLKYYLEVSKTSYNYSTSTEGKVLVENDVNVKRIPEDKNKFLSSSFEIVESFKNLYGNYLTRLDNLFSLEEVIKLPEAWKENEEDERYVIYFNPYTSKEGDSNSSYSWSKRFGICTLNNYLSNNKLLEETIKLYEFKILKKPNGDFSSVDDATCCLEKIDRTTFDIKNINLTNLLNDLVIENRNSNINISEAHIKPKAKETDNISIGMFNLGYTDDVFGLTRNRELDSQGDKDVLGKNNIAIGSFAMKNTENSGTEENPNYPENNIAIGQKTLANVKSGKNNIEIGFGNEKTVNTNNLINIGNNAKKIGTIKDNNIILGNDNLGNDNGNAFFSINNKNVVLGNENLAKGKQQNSVEDENTIIGNENSFSNIKNKNIIIGNKNGYELDKPNDDEASFVGLGNINTILGNGNNVDNFYNYNIVLGNKNGNENISSTVNSDNVIVGNENSANKNNFIFGNKNTLKDANGDFVIGNLNNSKGSNNTLIGKTNNIADNNLYNFVIGDSNKAQDRTENSFVIGNYNKVSNGKNSFVIGNNITSSNIENVIILGTKTDDTFATRLDANTKFALGPLDGIGYFDEEQDPDKKKSEVFLKINKDSFAEIFAENIKINTKLIDANTEINVNVLNSNKFLTQTLEANTQHINQNYETDIGEKGIPNAGNIPETVNAQKLLEYFKNKKSFIGSIAFGSDGRKDLIISANENNGYYSSNQLAIYTKIKPKANGGNGDDNGETTRLNYNANINNEVTGERQLLDSYGNQTIENNLTVNGWLKAKSFGATSSRAVKMGIVPTKHNAVEEINKINVVDFFFKTDKDRQDPKVGFIAEDTDPVFSTKEQNSMDFYNCIGMLLKAVQELSAENKELKERLEKLEK